MPDDDGSPHDRLVRDTSPPPPPGSVPPPPRRVRCRRRLRPREPAGRRPPVPTTAAAGGRCGPRRRRAVTPPAPSTGGGTRPVPKTGLIIGIVVAALAVVGRRGVLPDPGDDDDGDGRHAPTRHRVPDVLTASRDPTTVPDITIPDITDPGPHASRTSRSPTSRSRTSRSRTSRSRTSRSAGADPAADRGARRARRQRPFNELAQECYDGDMQSCDDLYRASPTVDSELRDLRRHLRRAPARGHPGPTAPVTFPGECTGGREPPGAGCGPGGRLDHRMGILDRILRAGEGKKLKALQGMVPDINALEPEHAAALRRAAAGQDRRVPPAPGQRRRPRRHRHRGVRRRPRGRARASSASATSTCS